MFGAVKIMWFGLAVAGLGFLAASCGNGNAQYRVVNGISDTSLADASGLAIYMNGSSVWPQVNFPSVEPGGAGKYQGVGGGTDTLEVYTNAQIVSGTPSGNPLVSSALDLGGGTQYTVVLAGNVVGTNTAAVEKYTDNNDQTFNSGVQVRVINASPVTADFNGVDVYILPPGIYPYSHPTPPTLNSGGALTFGNFINYTNVGIPTSGGLTVYVTAHNSTADYVPPLTISGFTSGTSIRTIVIVDGVNGTNPPQLELLTDVT